LAKEKSPIPTPYIRVINSVAEELLKNEKLEPHVKLFFLVLTTAAPNGHAKFGRKSLAILLGKPGKSHGDVKGVIARAIERGLVDEVSTPACVVLPGAYVSPEWGIWRIGVPHDGKHPNARFWDCSVHDRTYVPNVPATCHPDRKHHAKGLCRRCYQAKWKSEKETDFPTTHG